MASIDNIVLEPLGIFGHSNLELANNQPIAQAFYSAPAVVQLGASQLLRPVLTTVTYRMRAFDTTLAVSVHWNSGSIDVNGDDYIGPGPLADVVVVNLLFS